MSNNKDFFFDLETTGVNHWEHGIHQIGILIDVDGATQESLDLKVRPLPNKLIQADALAISGKSLEEVMAYPPATEIKGQLSACMDKYVDKYNKTDKFNVIGYNVHFDVGFFRAFFLDLGDNYYGSLFWANPIDVMVLASVRLKDIRPKMKNFQLRTVAETLGIVVDESKLHDAMYDLELTRQLYYLLK